MKQELIISKIKTCPDDFGYHVEYPDNFSPIKSNLTPEENQTHFNLVIAEAIADSLSPNYQLCAELMNSNFSIKSEQIEGYQERLQMLLKICTEEIREEANIPNPTPNSGSLRSFNRLENFMQEISTITLSYIDKHELSPEETIMGLRALAKELEGINEKVKNQGDKNELK